jgi:hypothetical protein
MIPTFSGAFSWQAHLMWGAIAFLGCLFTNSFIEWIVHKFVMHKPFIRYGFLHQTSHHGMFGSDHTYHAQNEDDKHHVLFTWREYALFMFLTPILYIPMEMLVKRPIFVGCMLAVFFGLQMFNSLHWRFHVPQETWFQRSRFFLFLKEHHRLHHADMTKNFNVYFFPFADWMLGTLKRH